MGLRVSPRKIFAVVLAPEHLRKTGLTALIVGSWLTAFNHGDVIFDGMSDFRLWVKVLLCYLTPFVVANIGLLSRRV